MALYFAKYISCQANSSMRFVLLLIHMHTLRFLSGFVKMCCAYCSVDVGLLSQSFFSLFCASLCIYDSVKHISVSAMLSSNNISNQQLYFAIRIPNSIYARTLNKFKIGRRRLGSSMRPNSLINRGTAQPTKPTVVQYYYHPLPHAMQRVRFLMR